jgi:hypothetical protein
MTRKHNALLETGFLAQDAWLVPGSIVAALGR